MKIESLAFDGALTLKNRPPAESADSERKAVKEGAASEPEAKKVQPEELLTQIKALAEGGNYSVRFEKDDKAGELVVRLVDQESGEVVRQIPAEELLELSERMMDLRGNLVDTAS